VVRDRFPVVVHTLVMRGGRLLLLRRSGTGYRDGWYVLPGGHQQFGESIVACAVRELAEETGLVVAPGQVRPAVVMPYRTDGEQGIDFIMRCDVVAGDAYIAEPTRCDDLGWWSADALPAQTAPYIPVALELLGRGEWFAEFDAF
jgi:8-oxo-dGTP diphosphatase